MEIDKQLYKEIKEFCALNDIKDVKGQINTCLRYGFNILKFGDNPFTYHNPMAENNIVKKEIEDNGGERGNCINDKHINESKYEVDSDLSVEKITSGNNGEIKSDVQKETITVVAEEKKKPKRKVRIIKN